MQRWIVIGVIAMAMVLGGGAFAYKSYKQNLPAPMWVPLQINPEFPSEKRREIAKELKANLCKAEILTQVSKDLGLREAWQMPSDAQCADELAKRIFVRPGERETSIGRVPTLDIGVSGKAKEAALSGKIAMRLMQDVWKILGIKAPLQQQ